jgi:opacity protein-like surface antigen
MKRFAFAIAFALLFALPPASASGQSIAIGPSVGVDAGAIEQPFIGADVRIGLGGPIEVNPTFNYYLTGSEPGLWSASVNGLYRFGIDNEVFTPYSGIGVGAYRFSAGRAALDSESTTGIGVNAKFGFEFLLPTVRPFLEAQYSPVFTSAGTQSLYNVKGGVLLRF